MKVKGRISINLTGSNKGMIVCSKTTCHIIETTIHDGMEGRMNAGPKIAMRPVTHQTPLRNSYTSIENVQFLLCVLSS
jgi:hypothetical protein